MDWARIFINALEAGIGVETVVFALAAIGLNVHFGYTGLLNFGQSAFLAVAAYGLGVTVATFDLPLWLGVIIGLAARRACSPCCSASRRCGCAPTTSRSSRSPPPRSSGSSPGR